MGIYEKFLIEKYTLIQKKKVCETGKKPILPISLVLKCTDVHFLVLDYVSGGETLILVDGKSRDFSRTKIWGTGLAFIYIIKESFKNWNLLIILFFVTYY